MITKTTVHIIGFIVNIPCKFFLASAFSWSESNLQFVVRKSSESRWKCGTLLMILYFLFLLYGFVWHMCNFKSGNMFSVTYHALYVIGYFCTMVDKVNYLRCRTFYIAVLNGCLKYYLHFSEISSGLVKKTHKRQILLLELCLKMLIHNIFTLPLFALIQYIRDFDRSVHLSSLLLNHPTLLKVFFCPIGIVQVMLMGSMISELTFNTILTVLTPFFYTSAFSSFRYSPSMGLGKVCLQVKVNNVPNLIPFMRTAQVTGNLYGKVLQGRILPLHFVLSYLTAISLFSLIKFYGRISWELVLILLSTGVTAASGWLVILWFLGQYYRTGRVFFVSWQYADWPHTSYDRKLMKKFYRSCPSTEFITSPKILYFRPVTMLKYLHFVNWLLAKALIVVD